MSGRAFDPGRWAVSRRDALVGTLACGVAVASVAMQPRSNFPRLTQEQIEAAIPPQIGPYRYARSDGLVQPPADELSTKLYDQILARVYAAPDSLPVMALFAYGSVQNLMLELHRPEKCYPEQGFVLSAPAMVPVQMGRKSISATMMAADRDDYHEQILYWTRIGQSFPKTSIAEKMVVMKSNLSGVAPDGMLVRISVPTADRDLGRRQIQGFVKNLVDGLPQLGRRLILGDG